MFKHTLRKARKLIRALTDLTYMQALRMGVAPGIEHEAVLKTLSCDAVVDIGANKGQFALVARRVFPDASLVAFEPLVRPAAVFARLFRRDDKVEFHRIGIGPVAENRVMYLSAAEDSSSILPIGEEQIRIFPGTQEAGRETVQMLRLDEVWGCEAEAKNGLLKIDVQGFELDVLKGCEGVLSRFSNVYCECSFLPLYEGQALADEVIAWLRVRGFRLKGIYNMSYDSKGVAVQGDFLFERAAL